MLKYTKIECMPSYSMFGHATKCYFDICHLFLNKEVFV